MASKNSSDTISMIQTAEGALGETHSILQRMRELAVQSANDTNTDSDRTELQNEVRLLIAEVDRIGNTTEFNTKKLLEGSAKGVSDEIVGTSRINNNSSLVLDAGKMKSMSESVAKDKSWAFDGAYMLVKTNQTFDENSKPMYRAEDYMMVGPNGAQYKFVTLNDSTEATEDEIKAGTIIAEGNYKVTGELTTSGINITLGNVEDNVDQDQVTTVAAGSVLSKGSTVTLEDGGVELKIEVSGKEIKIEWDDDTSVFKVNNELVAATKSVTLEDGTILKNEGAGVFTVMEGRVKLAEDLTDEKASAWTLMQDSILAEGTVIEDEDETVFVAGTVISAANTFVPGSVTFTGQNIQFSANAANALAANYEKAAVGDSVTYIFSEYQAPSSQLNDSVMAQIGANSGQTAFVSMGDMRARALGIADVNVGTKWGAATAIETVNNALQKVSHQRSSLGAIQNRLEHTIKNLDTAAENLQAAESRIRDVDMAKEIMEFTKNTILQQASQAMLAQANSQPQSVLALLR